MAHLGLKVIVVEHYATLGGVCLKFPPAEEGGIAPAPQVPMAATRASQAAV